jgi:uncharacterized RDD family membrane protein YckC
MDREDFSMTNPYAPPQATVLDISDPHATTSPADRGTRLGAAILDGIIFAVMVYLPMGIAAAFMGGLAAGTADSEASFGAILIGSVGIALVGFIVWCWLTIKYVKQNGQSIAKKLLAIKVVRTDGSPITLGRLFWLRNVVNGLISIIPFYGIIDLVFIFSESRQCLHDKIADTIVVKA